LPVCNQNKQDLKSGFKTSFKSELNSKGDKFLELSDIALWKICD
ncbi:15930_t:CDS:1, partial [Acaulospora colombiana]